MRGQKTRVNIFKIATKLVLLGLIVLGFWLRFNKVFETTVYNGDEGRDYLAAYHIWQGDHTLIGPAISTVRFFLPPTWYYLISIPLRFGGWNIDAPLLFIVLLGTASVWLYYQIGKLVTDSEIGGLITGSFFAFSLYAINASRMTGNHILIPTLSGIYFFFLVSYLKSGKERNFLLSSFFLGISFSLHFSNLVLVLFQIVFLFLSLKKLNFRHLFKKLAVHFFLLFIWWLPILVFDLRNGFINFKGLWWYLTQGDVDQLREQIGQGAWSLTNNVKMAQGFFRSLVGLRIKGNIWILHLLAIFGLGLFFRKREKKSKKIILINLLILALFFILFLFYKGYAAPHYFYSILPAYYLLTTIGCWSLISFLSTRLEGLKLFPQKEIFSLFFILVLVTLSIPYRYLKKDIYAANSRRVLLVKKVSDFIADDLSNLNEENYSIFLKKKEEFWSLAYEYKYLVEVKTGKRATKIDQYFKADILYIVAEIEVKDPLEIGNWEVKTFDPKKVDWRKRIDNYQVFRLSK